jgi:two-component system OmpR family sensor kinase
VAARSGVAVLEVDSTGPQLDGGFGLGLSIVDTLVTAHHGTMTLTAPVEGGLHVRVELPRAGRSS